MDISWIKLKTKMFDDEKIQLIEGMPEADAILVIWIKLLILAGKANSNGYILLAENIPYSPEMLSTIFRRPLQIIKFALKILKDFGMIEVTESNVMLITNWEKHQNIEGLDRVREQNRLRQSKHRNKKPALLEENKGIVTLPSRDVTQQIKNKNKDIDKEKI
ncbi:MAG: phage replisome organizer N-terminal domain-containing protein [Ignavibacteriales bacterium]|nr:phage replisome organizer N-terminal domain-containing protein [Ignavibacteriales bacterium]